MVGACVAEKIISNSSNWESCNIVDNQVNWTLYDKQMQAASACFPSRTQIYISCTQNFYANPPQPNPSCGIEFGQCMTTSIGHLSHQGRNSFTKILFSTNTVISLML
jgi:hypothetical protein